MKEFIKDHKVAAIFVSIFIILAIIVGVASSSSTKSSTKKSTTTTTQSSSSSTKSSGSSSTSSGSTSSTPSSSSSSSSGSSKSTGSSSSSSSTGSSSTGSSSKSSSGSTSSGTDSNNYDGFLKNDGKPIIVAKTKALYGEVMDAMNYGDTDAYYEMYWNNDFIAVEDGQKVKYVDSESVGYVIVKIATGDWKGWQGYTKATYLEFRTD